MSTQIDLTELQCPICMERYSDTNRPLITTCGHSYCQTCIKNCKATGSFACQICKKPINKDVELPINYSLESVNKILLNFSLDDFEKHTVINKQSDFLKTCAEHQKEYAYFDLNLKKQFCEECIKNTVNNGLLLNLMNRNNYVDKKIETLEQDIQCYENLLDEKNPDNFITSKKQTVKQLLDNLDRNRNNLNKQLDTKENELIEKVKKIIKDNKEHLKQSFDKIGNQLRDYDSYLVDYRSAMEREFEKTKKNKAEIEKVSNVIIENSFTYNEANEFIVNFLKDVNIEKFNKDYNNVHKEMLNFVNQLFKFDNISMKQHFIDNDWYLLSNSKEEIKKKDLGKWKFNIVKPEPEIPDPYEDGDALEGLFQFTEESNVNNEPVAPNPNTTPPTTENTDTNVQSNVRQRTPVITPAQVQVEDVD